MKLNKTLKQEYKMTYDGDAWGSCMRWLFAICDFLEFNRSGTPDHWQYRPSPMGADEEDSSYQFLMDSEIPHEEIVEFGNCLIRLRDILEKKGESY